MTDTDKQLREILNRRIVILDGAMGTIIQSHKLGEAEFRGDQFARHSHDLEGCNDVLCLTKPDLITEIHVQYFEAGADIVETNTFNSTRVSMADYKLEPHVYDLNVAGAKAAKKAAELVMAKDPSPGRSVRPTGPARFPPMCTARRPVA
jgi:5-methyltetrahydrofolate--homocysteine methyltransferase